ncbi:uncharacterized protein UV8b_07182 [Ustilaginoidea virens]|uniref:Uncharacterized protein n=1 Tax=Ustilaginoidea virens TaxID=1159556 RepID=A0A8E5MKJ5_USTVR|nr:uncharacterized protein UV8b_07182 [Ustilaginoidea virens]QUC22941.1 hypothetical protein UV8b_07182 [Ustilaginoidea virens]
MPCILPFPAAIPISSMARPLHDAPTHGSAEHKPARSDAPILRCSVFAANLSADLGPAAGDVEPEQRPPRAPCLGNVPGINPTLPGSFLASARIRGAGTRPWCRAMHPLRLALTPALHDKRTGRPLVLSYSRNEPALVMPRPR